MSQKDDSLPKLLKFQPAKLAKNRHKISEIEFFCNIGLFALNLDYIADYTQQAKSALNSLSHKKVVSQVDIIIF